MSMTPKAASTICGMRGGMLSIVTAGLLAGGCILPTNVAAQTNVINIGDAELLYADSQMPFTMDASFATLKRDSNTMQFFETDRGTSVYPLRYHGPLAYPLQTHDANAGWNFSGIYTGGVSGPWLGNIYDNGSGTLIGIIHREDFSANLGFFAIGLAKSTDGGANWKYLGDIVRPYGNNAVGNFSYSNIGGVPYLIVGDYMYVYFNEHTTADSTGHKRLAVARALTSDIMAAAATNSVPVFYKYAGGVWTQNGLTGLADNIIPNGDSAHTNFSVSEDFHSDAAYCAPLGMYLITVQTQSRSQLLLFTSTNGLDWGNETVVDYAPGYSQPYSTFASLNADASNDCHVVGNEFYLIYPRKNVNNYNDNTLYRRRITFGPVQNTDLVWDPNGNGTDGAGTWNASNLVWTNPASGGADIAWRNFTNDTAVFGVSNGMAGAVTVSGTVTLGNITFNPTASGNYTLSGGTLTLAGAPTVIIANADATIGSALTGTGFIKNGRGTLTLSGANTCSGDTIVNAGTLSITGGSLSSSSSINVLSGATLTTSVNNTFGSSPTAPWIIGGTMTGTANAQAMSPSVILNNGTMSGNTFAGYGTFLVTGSGATITADGASTINAGNFGLGGTLTLNTPNAIDVLTISSALGASSANTGGLTKMGAGTLQLSGTSTYTGGTAVDAGTLSISGGSLASSSSINVSSGATLTTSVNNTFGGAPTVPWTIGGTITGTAFAQSMPPSVTLNNGAMTGNTFATYGTFLVPSTPVTITANGSNNIISAGNLGLGAFLTVNTPNATDALAISSVLGASSVKSYGLTKMGAGTLTLSGANIYTGPTTVSNGRLIISTVFAGKGDFSVANGGTLAVTNVSSSSALASNLTIATGSALEFHNLSSTNVPLITASNVTVDGVCTIKIPYATGLDAGKTYPLIRYTGQFSGSFANLQLQLPSGATGTLVNGANQIALAITSVPSPAAPATLTAVGGVGQVTLNWNAVSFAASYNVKRSLTSGSGYLTIGTASGPGFLDTAVIPGQTYYYVVTASNSVGESGNSPEASATPQESLQAYLKFDESSGTTAADATGNGWNGTLVNGPTFVAGYSNNAVNLSSNSSQYVTLPAGVVSNLNDFTISAWVKQTTISTWSRIFDFGTGTTVYMFLTPRNGANNFVRFAITVNGNNNEQQIDGTAALPTNVWTHVAVTLSGSKGVLYVNGVAVGTNSTMTLTPASLGVTTQNYIGKSQYNDPYFNGQVDEFRIYSRALSPGEVATLATPLAAPTGLAAMAGDAQVALSWNAVANAAYYEVFRSLTNGGPYTQIAAVAATNSTDAGLVNGTMYYYVVKAANDVGASANSAQVSARPVSVTPLTSSAVFIGNQLQLSWPADHTGWRLQMSTNLSAANWQDVSGANATNQVSIPPTNANAFFRLVYP
jgi:autotransporter-associated beta strand protein